MNSRVEKQFMHTVCILWKVDPQNPPENWLLRQRKLGKKYLKIFNSQFFHFSTGITKM